MYLVKSETRLVYSIESNNNETIFSIISILMILCDIEFYKRQPQTKPNDELCISLQYISHSSLNCGYNSIAAESLSYTQIHPMFIFNPKFAYDSCLDPFCCSSCCRCLYCLYRLHNNELFKWNAIQFNI